MSYGGALAQSILWQFGEIAKSTFIVTTHFSNFNMNRRIHVYQIKLGILNHFKPKGQQKNIDYEYFDPSLSALFKNLITKKDLLSSTSSSEWCRWW